MRLLTRRSQIWTEMIVDQILTHNETDHDIIFNHLGFRDIEEPIVLQLGGCNPQSLARAVRIAYDFGYTDEINLNAGCPSNRVAGKGEFGATLMKNPTLIQECLKAMSLAAPVTVSLKTRLGVDNLDSHEFFDSFVDTILTTSFPDSANFNLVLHARKAWLNGLSPAQNRTIPPLNYDRAFAVCGSKPKLKKWFLNGGIETMEQAVDILRKAPSNMEGVMMGRAATNTPCLLANADVLLYGEDTNPATAKSRRSLLEGYCDYLHDKYSVDPDRTVTAGEVFLALKPLLGVFHGLKGNKLWRNSLDKFSRDQLIRQEFGVSGIINEALKEVDESILDHPLDSE